MKKKSTPSQLKIMWRWHHEGFVVRVWKDGWFGDTFKLVDAADFEVFKSLTSYLGIEVEEAMD
jgi:hypothetical protein